MATDNNKLSSMAAETDAATDERTSELEVLSVDLIPTEEELEMDAKTFSLELDEADRVPDPGEISILQSDLRSKDERISNLQFDIEQLRTRWTGLEKEISAREELTEMLQADLKSANQSILDKDQLLDQANTKLVELTNDLESALSTVEAATSRAAALEASVGELAERSEADTATIADLRKRLQEAEDALPPPDDPRDQIIADNKAAIAELNAYVDGRKQDWEQQTQRVEELTVQLNEQRQLAETQQQALTTAERTAADARSENARLTADLKQARSDANDRAKELKQLNRKITKLTDAELPAAQRLIDEQHGQIAAHEQSLSELEERASRADRYADELRDKLADALEKTTTSAEQTQQLESELDGIRTELSQTQNERDDQIAHIESLKATGDELKQQFEMDIQELRRELETAREAVKDQEARNDKLTADLDERNDRIAHIEGLKATSDEANERLETDIQEVRRELATAREAVKGQEARNDQLTADLDETRAFKKVLEDQLTSYEQSHAEELEQLREQATKLQEQLTESEQKIANKDNAVAALLAELASKSKTIESIEEIESAIHDIDNRMSKRIDDRSDAERERPTRLLVGDIDGQKLRFPLFKDRLTIGRTVQNDIQIRAQFISRRHAVVITDESGTKIVDWGSKNGVFVNKERVSEQLLNNGDTVTIGTAEFTYEERARRSAE